MDFEVMYWHWIVMGVALMLVEIAITTFFVLWFGVAAILVGVLVFFLPQIGLNWQIFTWTVLSAVLAMLWFKYLKPLAINVRINHLNMHLINLYSLAQG